MNRGRLIGTLLAVILLGCVAVIVLDQMGMFGPSQSASTPAPSPGAPVGTPTNGNGYGDLK